MARRKRTEVEATPATEDTPEERQRLAQLQQEAEALEEEKRRRNETAKFVQRVMADENRTKKAIFPKKASASGRNLRTDILNAERFTPAYNVGLTSEQVQQRIDKKLTNVSHNSTVKTYKAIIFENVFTFFNVLCLIVAAALIAVRSFNDLFFLGIMFANISISIYQEVKAKRIISRLSLISAPTAFVVRDKERVQIHIEDVVLDDILYLENGKQICADSIVIRGEVEVNESLLSGESVPILKKEGDTLYGGSFVSSGNCHARVDQIGSTNYMESLTAFAKKYRKARSELLGAMRFIIRLAGFFIVPTAIVLFVITFNSFPPGTTDTLANTVTSTAAAIIGMIPAGMFLLTSITLFVSVNKLAARNVLVQDLYCIEMLARIDVLCLDKTGTITDGTMIVKETMEFDNKTEYNLKDIVGSFLAATGDNNQTASALATHYGFSLALTPKMTMPFSSQRKYSAVIFEKVGCFILGAPEFIMRDMGVKMEKLVNLKAQEGYRVLMLAFSPTCSDLSRLPADRKPMALFILEDHIREDAIPTLNWFHENDVEIKIISGDNPLTVSEVARRVGIANAQKYISLDGLADSEVIEVANLFTVFGRVSPEQKRLLIRSMKAKGKKVAMTGDGVNDILALKEADCSVAMANGSEASRNVSHLVLQDSNFSNMPNIVLEGRRVVNNIQKSSSLFLMKTLFSMIFSLVFVFMQSSYPIKPRHLLPLEMFIIGIPSFVLAFQSNKKRIEGNFIVNVLKNSFPAGVTLVISALAIYIFCYSPYFNYNPTQSEFFTMIVFAITYTGWIALFILCSPLDSYRTVLVMASFSICLATLLSVPGFFEMTNIDFIYILFTLVIVQGSYFALGIIRSIVGFIRIN